MGAVIALSPDLDRQGNHLKEFVYDLEIMKNCFQLGIGDMDDTRNKCYEISTRRDDREGMLQLLRWLRSSESILTGWNSKGFDEPILMDVYRALVRGASVEEINRIASDKCRLIISDGAKARKNPNKHGLLKFKHILRPRQSFITQRDLFMMHHYDGKDKNVSLKDLEFSMAMDNLKTLPVKPDSVLTHEQMAAMEHYLMEGDIPATRAFRIKSERQVVMRRDFTSKYDTDFTNFNDTKIGKTYVIDALKKKGIKTHHKVNGKWKPKQTPIPKQGLDLGKVVFPYIRFKTPELNAVLDFFKSTTIMKTKEAFKDFPTSEMGELSKFLNRAKKKEGGMVKREMTRLGKHFPERVTAIHVVLRGETYVLGTGGLHMSIKPARHVAGWDEVIEDIDVTSFYPSIVIQNGLFPRHLSPVFIKVYAEMLEKRLGFAKGTAENLMLKLALNGTYGNLINAFDCLYDPFMAMQITINGQLMLLMLVEHLLISIPNLEILQCNTDGITYKCKRQYQPYIRRIVGEWERVTKMQMEYAEYSKMIVRDVNNYIAETASHERMMKGYQLIQRSEQPPVHDAWYKQMTGEWVDDEEKAERKRQDSDKGGAEVYRKLKGAYEYDFESYGAWHKNFSNRATTKAVEAYMMDDTPIRESLENNDNLYDFMLLAKTTGQSTLHVDGALVQKSSRYYMSLTGGTMTKKMPPTAKSKDGKWKEQAMPMTSGWLTKVCNSELSNVNRSDIDMDYYIAMATQLIVH